MNIRRGLIRIWVVLSALLLIPLVSATYENWVEANRDHAVEIDKHWFFVSRTIMGLPEVERNQVIHRISWLKGIVLKSRSWITSYRNSPSRRSWKPWRRANAGRPFCLPEETWPFLLVSLMMFMGRAFYRLLAIVSGFQSFDLRDNGGRAEGT